MTSLFDFVDGVVRLHHDEEEDVQEEEEIAMILLSHKAKKPKHGGSVMGREYIRRERHEAHEKLMRSYFVDKPVFPERYFRRRLISDGD